MHSLESDPTKPFAVVGVGNSTQDYLGIVDRLPELDSGATLVDFAMCGGGVVATALVAAARLGCVCSYVGAVGDDADGRAILDGLASEGVGTDLVACVAGHSSARSIVLVHQASGKRSIIFQPATARMDRLPVGAAAAIREAGAVHICDLGPLEVEVAAVAREVGAVVSADVGAWSPECETRLGLVDVLIVPEALLAGLGVDGESDESILEALARLRALGPGTVVVTRGDRGCIGVRGDEEVRLPAFDIDVVDTTGAGDVFHGAYLAALGRDMPFSERLRYASAAAALSCRALGGRPAIPAHAEVAAFLDAAEPYRT